MPTRRPKHAMRLGLSALLLLLLVLGAAPGVAISQGEPDFDIPNGHFYTQTGGGTGMGYSVTDEGGIPFWTEFLRLGGVQGVGYPASHRFLWDGFVLQVFQRVVFQWRPETGRVRFVNVFDLASRDGQGPWLLSRRGQTPPPRPGTRRAGPGSRWWRRDPWRAGRLPGDPGEPTSPRSAIRSRRTGLRTQRSSIWAMSCLRDQRVRYQQWKEDVPWAKAGQGDGLVGRGHRQGNGPHPRQSRRSSPPCQGSRSRDLRGR